MKYLLIFLCLLTAPSLAAAEIDENPYKTLRTLPTPTVQTIDGQENLCTDKEGWRTVLLIAADYQGLFMWRLEIQGVLDAHAEIVTAYELEINNYEASLKLLQSERDYQKTRVGELESAILKGNSGHKVEKFLMWGVILIETIAIGALGVASFVQAN